MIVQALAHWVQELDLYKDAPDGPGATWKGCVLKSCKSPNKHQTRCHAEDEQHQALYGSELAQDAAHGSNLHDKAHSIAAYMQQFNQKYRQNLNAIWANNGKGLLIGYPGSKSETIRPDNAAYYKLLEAKFQVDNAACTAGKRLGEIMMSVTRQEIINTDGIPDKECKSTCGVGSIAVLRAKIDNLCYDCGSSVDKSFYLRVEHWKGGACRLSGKEPRCDKVDHVVFEFTSRKALACGSTGTFDIILSSLDTTKKVKEDQLWPEHVKLTLVSPCREELAYMWMTKKDPAEKLVAPSWLGMFGR
jgi:hypothetical protein